MAHLGILKIAVAGVVAAASFPLAASAAEIIIAPVNDGDMIRMQKLTDGEVALHHGDTACPTPRPEKLHGFDASGPATA